MRACESWAAHILSVLSVNKLVSKSMMACSLGTFESNPKFVGTLGQLEYAGRILIGWDEALGTVLTLVDAPETAQDAPEEVETGIGSTPAAESGTGQTGPVEEGGWNTERRAMQSVAELVEKYQAMREELVALRNDHRRLFDDHMALKKQRDTLNEAANIQAEAWNALVVDREAYIALKEKLRGMLDAD